jgi:hypothetical protein
LALFQHPDRVRPRRSGPLRPPGAPGRGRQAVFHRAFDVTPEPLDALDQLIGLGFRRLLTSGQEESAYNGTGLIAG